MCDSWAELALSLLLPCQLSAGAGLIGRAPYACVSRVEMRAPRANPATVSARGQCCEAPIQSQSHSDFVCTSTDTLRAVTVEITAHKQVCHPSAWMAHLLVCCNLNSDSSQLLTFLQCMLNLFVAGVRGFCFTRPWHKLCISCDPLRHKYPNLCPALLL
jgi:hypothetical protein